MADTISQTVLFPDLFDKPLVATFDQQHASSDGGAVLLKAAERQYGLIDGFAECLVDDRQPGKVRHTLADLLGQRIFGIACGHPDGNDGDRLADDPIHRYCQVDEKLVDRPPRYWAQARREPAMLGIRNGLQPQLDNTLKMNETVVDYGNPPWMSSAALRFGFHRGGTYGAR